MEAVLSIVLLVFSVLIYELERGSECFVAPSPEAIVNDLRNEFSYCQVVPSEVENIVHPGDRLLINKNGDISKFSNIVDCMWFCYVTATTTGFGDRWPITNGGMYVNLFLMLSGSLYLAMPLTVASGTYYAAHTRYLKSKKKTQALQTLSGAKLAPFHAASFTPAVQNSLQRLYEVLKAELAEMRLITNHMRREHVSYLKFEDKKGDQKHKTGANKDSEEDSSDDSSVSEDQPWEKPPLTRELLKSVNRLQEVLRMSKKDVQELALLDYRRMEHLNKLEEWSSTNFDR